MRQKSIILTVVALITTATDAFTPQSFRSQTRTSTPIPIKATIEDQTATTSTPNVQNVLQTENTSRDNIMTFSYDMSIEPAYEKPTYPGTGNGLSGDSGEYDVIVIGSGMGGLACGALRFVGCYWKIFVARYLHFFSF